jgi:hypothetical protein
MAKSALIPDDTAEQQMATLELRYRYARDSLDKARALYRDLGASADADDPDARHAMARVQHLQARLSDLQRAMKELEDRTSIS